MGAKPYSRRGIMLIISSPSGAGKTTITRRLLEIDSNLRMSVSATTRPKRPDEIGERDYRFMSEAKFKQMIERGEFLEHAQVFDHWYGTPREPVEEALAKGQDMLFDIDWQGSAQLAQAAPDDVVRVFILPPSWEELRSRLKRRAQDSDDVVSARMAKAADEMSHYAEYDYIVTNADLDESVRDTHAVLMAERLRRNRQRDLDAFVRSLREG